MIGDVEESGPMLDFQSIDAQPGARIALSLG
jgi:hypothetical protein